ncbi:MAG TPA: ABC transporter C-terminal domain-containing protein, partial [Chthonomonadaceae bacterium]|nr:ABC transporter C-terminal domain-containing protein [Chthonomonadaceae bacterium]
RLRRERNTRAATIPRSATGSAAGSPGSASGRGGAGGKAVGRPGGDGKPAAGRTAGDASAGPAAGSGAGQAASAARVAPRRLSTAEQRELAGMEAAIEAAEAEAARLHDRLAEPSVAADHVEARRVYASYEQAQERIAALYVRWEELESRQSAVGNRQS